MRILMSLRNPMSEGFGICDCDLGVKKIYTYCVLVLCASFVYIFLSGHEDFFKPSKNIFYKLEYKYRNPPTSVLCLRLNAWRKSRVFRLCIGNKARLVSLLCHREVSNPEWNRIFSVGNHRPIQR